MPNTLFEAAATGRPIVTTDTPGCREVVTHGVNGLLVPPEDIPALAAAIGELLGDADLRLHFGVAGRHRAEAEFGEARGVQQALDLYYELLDR